MPSASNQSPPFPRVAYITNYRASMLLITTICILAVDFPVFPRRLAKTENFGFGMLEHDMLFWNFIVQVLWTVGSVVSSSVLVWSLQRQEG